MRRLISSLAALTLSLLFLTPVARAQENAVINGTVTDSSGAVIPNATVTLTQVETGEVRTTPTNSAGFYNFPGLPIGHYNVAVTAPGFKKLSRTNIVLNTAQTLQENATLQVGSQGQTVTVQANALQVQAETNEVSNLITGSQVTQLATNGRNITALAVLGTGVSANIPDYNGVNALTAGNSISFNGTRPSHNDYLIDGGEIYDRGCGGCYSILPSDDAIAQFQTLDSNYSPDYGIASGGQILMVLKSGTRDFHGGAWEFNRNEDFNADSYITKLNHQPKPELRLNLFGANIGGPLFIPHVYNTHRDKTFFFWNEEWRRQIIGQAPTVLTTVPIADFPVAGQPLTYQLPAGGKTVPVVPATQDPAKLALYKADGLTPNQPFPNNTIPANLIDHNAVLFMDTGAIPKPNGPNNTYVASPAAPTNVREDLVRIDHKINEKYQLMGHYIHDAVVQTAYPPLWGPSKSYPTVGSVMSNPAWTGVIKLTQTLSPNLLNETMFSVDGNKLHFTPTGIYAQPSGFAAGTFFSGNNALNRLPEIDLGTPYGQNFSTSYFPWVNAAFAYQTRDDISITRGHHSLKFGAGWLHFIKNQQLQANTQGTFSFQAPAYSGDSYVNFLLGFASSFTQLQALNTDHWVNDTFSFYALDNWHVLPSLTLNLGLRYDALPHAYERFNRFANFIPGDYNPAAAAQFNSDGSLNQHGPGFVTPPGFTTPFYLNGIVLAGQNGVPRGQVKNYYGTWGPRIGFAYDVLGNGKTVVRGGFGIFVERIQGNDVYDADINPPFSYQPTANTVYFSNATQNNQTGLTSKAPSFPANLQNLAYNYAIPSTAQFSFGIQREVARSMVAVVQYVGNTAWHQSDDRSINTLTLNNPNRQAVANGANANPYRQYPGYSNINQEEVTTNSNYNSFQAGFRMENRHNLTLQLAYTWSHELDFGSNDLAQLSNPFNPRYNYGSGQFDQRNNFNANYIYSIPFFTHSSSLLARQALGGWQLAGIVIAISGFPAPSSSGNGQVTYGTDTLGLGGGSQVINRPDRVPGVSTKGPKTQKEFFNTAAFAPPLAPWQGGTNQGFGNAGKDAVVGPGRVNFSTSLYKTFPLGRSDNAPRFEFRAESFNTFNHTQFQHVDTGYTDNNFGQVTTTWDPRVFQFGGKFLF